VCFDYATWHGNTVPCMHWQAVPVHWAVLGVVDRSFFSFFAYAAHHAESVTCTT